ncbi:MAG: LysE family translocator [Sphingomonadales bacterium]|nr:MAG: LysE family translocator [Sphingomonadales bacterium]
MLLPIEALAAFTLAAALLTIAPGLDSALVLRTAATDGQKPAFFAGLGIVMGCFVWGLIVALGLGAVIAASELAYTILRWIGAAYLLYLGWNLIFISHSDNQIAGEEEVIIQASSAWFKRGFLTNLLNPKIGVFYVSFLPQFIPVSANIALNTVLLALIHALLGLIWFAILIGATRSISMILRRPRTMMWIDRITGGLFLAFGARLLVSSAR